MDKIGDINGRTATYLASRIARIRGKDDSQPLRSDIFLCNEQFRHGAQNNKKDAPTFVCSISRRYLD